MLYLLKRNNRPLQTLQSIRLEKSPTERDKRGGMRARLVFLGGGYFLKKTGNNETLESIEGLQSDQPRRSRGNISRSLRAETLI